MSGFENYRQELAELDREIRYHAAICGLDLANPYEVEACRNEAASSPQSSDARQSLRGLLLLRIKVETEMIEQGLAVPPLQPPPPL